MSLYDAVRDLPLEIESYDARSARAPGARATSCARRLSSACSGRGEEGIGEDVTYHGEEHDRLQVRGPDLPLAGSWTLHSFSEHLATLPLFEAEPAQHAYYDYRRWGFESAALDLALRQAGTSLGEAIGREPRPVSFVVSGGLGDPPATERLHEWLALYPDLRFKLDANQAWTEDLDRRSSRRPGAVDSIDFKGQYRGTVVDAPPDPALYRRVAEGLPERLARGSGPHRRDDGRCSSRIATASRGTRSSTRSRTSRRSPWPPKTVNVKPSRFGSVERLFAAYDYCEARRNRRLRRRPVGARASVAATSSSWPR